MASLNNFPLETATDAGISCGVAEDRKAQAPRHLLEGVQARSLAYLHDITAGDPGCKRNQDLWDRMTAGQKSHAPDLIEIAN